MNLNILDYIWISLIMLVNVFFFIRKYITAVYGHGSKFSILIIDPFYEHKKLKEIAIQQSSKNKRIIFTTINILIPVLFISGIVIAIISVKFFHPHGPFLNT